MNMPGPRLRILGGALLLAVMPAHSPGASTSVKPPGGLVRVQVRQNAAPRFPAETLVFSNIAALGKEPVALLCVKHPHPIARPTASDIGVELGHWLAAGDSSFLLGYTVKAIAPDHVIVVRPDTGAEIKIPLASAPVAASDLKPYSRAWINSRANPMLFSAQEMPGKMFGGAWDKLTARQKTPILKFYRQHGWELIPVKPGLGPTEFDWRNLYEAERAAAIEANRDNFARTLNPEQQALWKQMRGFQNVYPEPGGFTDAQRELVAARQRIIDEFKQSLTPEQKAEHASIQDFTKASWK